MNPFWDKIETWQNWIKVKTLNLSISLQKKSHPGIMCLVLHPFSVFVEMYMFSLPCLCHTHFPFPFSLSLHVISCHQSSVLHNNSHESVCVECGEGLSTISLRGLALLLLLVLHCCVPELVPELIYSQANKPRLWMNAFVLSIAWDTLKNLLFLLVRACYSAQCLWPSEHE